MRVISLIFLSHWERKIRERGTENLNVFSCFFPIFQRRSIIMSPLALFLLQPHHHDCFLAASLYVSRPTTRVFHEIITTIITSSDKGERGQWRETQKGRSKAKHSVKRKGVKSFWTKNGPSPSTRKGVLSRTASFLCSLSLFWGIKRLGPTVIACVDRSVTFINHYLQTCTCPLE